MPQISRRRLAQATLRLLQQQPDRQSAILRSLAAYMLERKQVKQLDLFVNDLAVELEKTGQLQAEGYSAFKLDTAGRDAIKQYLEKATGANNVVLHESIDTSPLSGVVVRTADKELDTSARRQLQRLANLTPGEN